MKLRLLLALGAFSQVAHASDIPDAATDKANSRIDRLMPRIERMVAQYSRAFSAPGTSVAIVTPNQARFIARGVREAGRPGPITPGTTFQLASVSKPITATLAAALVSQGKLAFDEPVTDLLPLFRFQNLATTRQTTVGAMLAQRSGLPGGTGDTLEALGYGQNDILRQMKFVDTTPKFEKAYAYANYGITIGGVAAAAAVRSNYPKALDRNVFRPLGMAGAFVPYERLLRTRNRAALHFTIDGVSRPMFVRNAQAQAPGGGVNATAHDMAKFLQLYLNDGAVGGRQLIDADVLKELYQPISPTGKNPLTGAPKFYGMCWNVTPPFEGEPLTISHSGAFFAGARTVVTFWPTEGIGIAVLSNNFPSFLPEAIADAFHQIFDRGRAKPSTLRQYKKFERLAFNIDGFLERYRNTEDTGPTINGRPVAAYAGVYRNDYVGRIAFTVRTDSSTGQPALFFKAGPKLPALEVKRVKNREALMVTTGEGEQIDLDFADFRGGAFQKLKIADFDAVDWGTLDRQP